MTDFAHLLALYITRNGRDKRYPATENVQYAIEQYLFDNGIKVTYPKGNR